MREPGLGRTRALQQLGESAQPPVGGHPDGAGLLAEHPGGALGVQLHDDPQQDGLGLVARQPGDQRERVGGADGGEGGARGVVAGGQFGQVLQRQVRGGA